MQTPAKNETAKPGWAAETRTANRTWIEGASRLLTDPVRGLESYTELFKKLTNPNGSIKVFCEVAEL